MQAISENPLSIRLLGDLRVTRGGAARKLPPSRKTRALLSYLLLTGREHRRERLCGLFWDVADDPRGALRWSLSKLRGLVDEPGVKRVLAGRDSVRLAAAGAAVDALELRAELGAPEAVAGAATERLERWASAFGGELMEGLDLPDFHEFQAWLVAEREQMRRLHAAIAGALSERLAAEPERALAHARTWTKVDPLNLQARTALLRLCLAAGRGAEAEQHFASAQRTFEELGSRDLESLAATWQALRRSAPAQTAVTAPAPQDRPSNVLGHPAQPARCVGRARELSTLLEALRRCQRGAGAHVRLLSGEPGIGKTHLLTELREAALRSGASVMWGAAFEGETGRPYGPFLDALRQPRESDPDGDDAGLARLLAAPRADEGEASRDHLFSAVSDRIAARASAAPPLLLVLDDVQWLDPASAELLHYVARSNRERPLLLVLATRSEEAPDNAALARALRSLRRDRLLSETALAPLDAAAVEELVTRAGSEVDARVVIEQCGGNPLFALELARVGAREGERLPSSVADAVRERLERLGAESADVLRWAAVLGTSFTIERLEALMALPMEPLVTALEDLERACLLLREAASDGGEHYRFAHEVVRRVVYADLSEPRRRLMHRRVAGSLREREDLGESLVAEIAQHATLGHDHDLAASACAAAGKRCLRVFANAEALTLARRGMHHASMLGGLDRLKRTIELMEVQFLASGSRDAELDPETLRDLGERALAEGAVTHARLAFHLRSYLNWQGGAWDDAARDTMLAESASRGGDERQHVFAMAESARCLILLERELAHADALLTEAEARGRPLRLQPAAMFDGRGMLAIHRGKLDEAASAFDRAYGLARADGDRLLEFYAVEHRIVVEVERADYARAGELCGRLIELGARLREGSEAPFASTIAALVRYGQGEDCDAELSEGLAALRLVDAKFRLAYALTRAALIDIERGEHRRALARASEARHVAELLERPSERLLALMIEAHAATALDELEREQQARAAIAARSWEDAAATVRARCAALLGTQAAAATDGAPTEPARADTALAGLRR